jgi:hypothetical protein
MKNAYFISFQCFISVILKNTEKMKLKKKKIQFFRSISLKKIFSFSVLFVSVSVRNLSEFFSILVIPE